MGHNRINNSEMTHNHFGFVRLGEKPGQVGLGFHNPWGGIGHSKQFPAEYLLKQLSDASPFAFRTMRTPAGLAAPLVLGTLLDGDCRYPCVLYSADGFGTIRQDPSTIDRVFKKWRMYVQKVSNGAIYMLESDDGVTWGTPELMDNTAFPAAVDKAKYGVHIDYDPDGLVTYDDGALGPVTYKFAGIYRIANATTGDATDMRLVLSNDGITWVVVVMANHDVSGNPYGNELASSLGMGAAAMFKQGTGLTFNANFPRSFFNSDGWHSYQRYSDEATPIGDTILGATIMGQNSNDPTDANEIGHFANWNRNLLRQVGERSFGQMTKMVPWRIVKHHDLYLALVQLYYHEAAAAVLVPSGLALAISMDGLIFESMGPLYDAGLTHALNDRTDTVNQTNMKPTAALYNQNDGTGAGVHAGSLVVDQNGFNFGGDVGKDNDRPLIRVYWTEEDSDKCLMGIV